MTLKVATRGRERYYYEDKSYYQKHSECVWAKIIEQELSLSVCLKPVCIPSS